LLILQSSPLQSKCFTFLCLLHCPFRYTHNKSDVGEVWIFKTRSLPSLAIQGSVAHLSVAILYLGRVLFFSPSSTRSPISERRYFVTGWSFMELLPVQYWIFVSMWHCFARLESTKRIRLREPKTQYDKAVQS
jgi:hypothetical protein